MANIHLDKEYLYTVYCTVKLVGPGTYREQYYIINAICFALWIRNPLGLCVSLYVQCSRLRH